MSMCAYLLLYHEEHTFRAGNVNTVTQIYGKLRRYTDDHMQSNSLVNLKHFKNLERIFR